MSSMLIGIFKSLFFSLLTEAVIKEIILFGLEEASKRSDNTIDDKLVETVKKAWRKDDKSESDTPFG